MSIATDTFSRPQDASVQNLLLSDNNLQSTGQTFPWTPNTTYLIDDQITINSQLYRCKTKHKSTITFDPLNWEYIGKETVTTSIVWDNKDSFSSFYNINSISTLTSVKSIELLDSQNTNTWLMDEGVYDLTKISKISGIMAYTRQSLINCVNGVVLTKIPDLVGISFNIIEQLTSPIFTTTLSDMTVILSSSSLVSMSSTVSPIKVEHPITLILSGDSSTISSQGTELIEMANPISIYAYVRDGSSIGEYLFKSTQEAGGIMVYRIGTDNNVSLKQSLLQPLNFNVIVNEQTLRFKRFYVGSEGLFLVGDELVYNTETDAIYRVLASKYTTTGDPATDLAMLASTGQILKYVSGDKWYLLDDIVVANTKFYKCLQINKITQLDDFLNTNNWETLGSASVITKSPILYWDGSIPFSQFYTSNNLATNEDDIVVILTDKLNNGEWDIDPGNYTGMRYLKLVGGTAKTEWGTYPYWVYTTEGVVLDALPTLENVALWLQNTSTPILTVTNKVLQTNLYNSTITVSSSAVKPIILNGTGSLNLLLDNSCINGGIEQTNTFEVTTGQFNVSLINSSYLNGRVFSGTTGNINITRDSSCWVDMSVTQDRPGYTTPSCFQDYRTNLVLTQTYFPNTTLVYNGREYRVTQMFSTNNFNSLNAAVLANAGKLTSLSTVTTFNGTQTYLINDIAVVARKLYRCRVAYTSSNAFSDNIDNWELLVENVVIWRYYDTFSTFYNREITPINGTGTKVKCYVPDNFAYTINTGTYNLANVTEFYGNLQYGNKVTITLAGGVKILGGFPNITDLNISGTLTDYVYQSSHPVEAITFKNSVVRVVNATGNNGIKQLLIANSNYSFNITLIDSTIGDPTVDNHSNALGGIFIEGNANIRLINSVIGDGQVAYYSYFDGTTGAPTPKYSINVIGDATSGYSPLQKSFTDSIADPDANTGHLAQDPALFRTRDIYMNLDKRTHPPTVDVLIFDENLFKTRKMIRKGQVIKFNGRFYQSDRDLVIDLTVPALSTLFSTADLSSLNLTSSSPVTDIQKIFYVNGLNFISFGQILPFEPYTAYKRNDIVITSSGDKFYVVDDLISGSDISINSKVFTNEDYWSKLNIYEPFKVTIPLMLSNMVNNGLEGTFLVPAGHDIIQSTVNLQGFTPGNSAVLYGNGINDIQYGSLNLNQQIGLQRFNRMSSQCVGSADPDTDTIVTVKTTGITNGTLYVLIQKVI